MDGRNPFDIDAWNHHYNALLLHGEPAQQPDARANAAVSDDIHGESPTRMGFQGLHARGNSAPDEAIRPRSPSIGLNFAPPWNDDVEGGDPHTLHTGGTHTSAPQRQRRSRIQCHPHDKDFFARLFAAYGDHSTLKKYGEKLRAFSEWLFDNKREAIAGRLNDPGLDLDLEEYSAPRKSWKEVRSALARIRRQVGTDGQFLPAPPPKSRRSVNAAVDGNDTRWGREIISDADDLLLKELRTAAECGQSSDNEIAKVVGYLRQFSGWLGKNGKQGLAARIHTNSDSLEADVEVFIQAGGTTKTRRALEYLREAATSILGVTSIKPLSHEIPVGDKNLIERFLRAMVAGGTDRGTASNYATNLRRFCNWLSTNGKSTLADRVGLSDAELDHDLEEFEAYLEPSFRFRQRRDEEAPPRDAVVVRSNARPALRRLRQLSTGIDLLKFGKGYQAPPEDAHLLSELYKHGRGGLARDDGVLANIVNLLYRFSEWLKRNDRQGLAARILTDEIGLNADGEEFSNAEAILLNVPIALKHLRWWTEGPGESFFSGLSREHEAFRGYGHPLRPADTMTYPGGLEFDLNALSEEAAPQACSDSIFEGLSSLGSTARYGSPAFAPSTPSEIEGPSQPQQPLPVGPLGNNLHIALAQLGTEMGFASGDTLSCLIDTALQFSSNVRRHDNGQTRERELDAAVALWREHLFAAGVVPRHGQIDFYDGSRAGQDLALNLGVRIQMVQWENSSVIAHPVLGQQGPLVHILHTPGHFQPLWPRGGRG